MIRRLALGVLLGLLLSAPALGAPEDGRKVFLLHKCNLCHVVSPDENPLPLTEDEKKRIAQGEVILIPPNLSDVGLRRDKEFLAKFLRQKTELEGRQHQQRFEGTKEDFFLLIDWLLTLKTPPIHKQ